MDCPHDFVHRPEPETLRESTLALLCFRPVECHGCSARWEEFDRKRGLRAALMIAAVLFTVLISVVMPAVVGSYLD